MGHQWQSQVISDSTISVRMTYVVYFTFFLLRTHRISLRNLKVLTLHKSILRCISDIVSYIYHKISNAILNRIIYVALRQSIYKIVEKHA